MTFPQAPPAVVLEMRQVIFDLGKQWAVNPARPSISRDVLAAWDKLLDAWISDASLPLLVRRFDKNRGSVIHGAEGRMLVPTDNSPAGWAYATAHAGQCPRVEDISSLLESGQVPVAMIRTAAEGVRARYRGVRGSCLNVSAARWKLGHIEPVRLGKGSPDKFPPRVLEAHFRRFLSPSNMLVVPMELAGLTEIPGFLDGYRVSLINSEIDTGAGVN